jgi:hypothetical protein
VDRDKLLKISGHTRKPQFALAENLGVTDYPCPAGGCLLTDKVIAARLRDLFAHTIDYNHIDLVLLTVGRHYRLHTDLKIILGRNKDENERIFSLAKSGQSIFEPDDFRGPTILAPGHLDADRETTIGEIIVAHSQDTKPRIFTTGFRLFRFTCRRCGNGRKISPCFCGTLPPRWDVPMSLSQRKRWKR